MLARTHDLAAHQLLQDLLAVKDILRQRWLKGGFKGAGGTRCTVAAVNETVGLPEGSFTHVREDQIESEPHARAGRMIFSLYTQIYGPDAPTNITVSQAASKIAHFNDHPSVSHETVCLAVDRAIAELMG